MVVGAFAAADALVLLLPVHLLALGGAVGRVPAAVVDGLVLARLALGGQEGKIR